MTAPLDRRTLLRGIGTVSAGAVLAACSSGSGDDPAATDTGTTALPDGAADGADLAQQAAAAAGVDAPLVLTPIVATFELLTTGGRIPFGVLGQTNAPILGADVTAWVVDMSGELVAGPITPTFYGEGLGPRGIYIAETELPSPGIHDLVVLVEGPEGARAGTAALNVVDPSTSTTFPPGTTFPAVSTPTVDDQQDLDVLCTAEPDCSMHDVNAADVVGTGRPVVLSISTPAYCATAVCGPVIQVVDGVKSDLGRDDIAFIHAEVFRDAGNTTTAYVDELRLPTEPWTWIIDGDGVVVDRFDGPVVPELLLDALGQV